MPQSSEGDRCYVCRFFSKMIFKAWFCETGRYFLFDKKKHKPRGHCDLTRMAWAVAKSSNLKPGLLLAPHPNSLKSHTMFLSGYCFPLKKTLLGPYNLGAVCSFTIQLPPRTQDGPLPGCFLRHSFVLGTVRGFSHSPREGHHISRVLVFVKSYLVALCPHHWRQHLVRLVRSNMIASPLGSLPSLSKNEEETVILHLPTRGALQCAEALMTTRLETRYRLRVFLHFQSSFFSWLY